MSLPEVQRIQTRSPFARATFALVLAGALACGDPAAPDDAPRKIESLPRQLSVAERALIDRSNSFAFDLLREVYVQEDESPNVFLSPLSASMALGMTMNGAAGETFDSMRATLGFEGLSQEEINRSFHDLTDMLLTLDPRVELTIANSTWARQGFSFVPTFFETVRTWFDAEARELDFDDPKAVEAINGWAKEKTQGRIPEVIEHIKPDHILFLLNAIDFKGQWTDRFDAAKTRTAPFTLADGSIVQVNRMSGRPKAGSGRGDGVQIAELPYGGQAFVMTIVLPSGERTLSEVIEGLDAETWARWMESIGAYRELVVELPKFEIEYEIMLNDALIALGMGPAFGPRADFSRLTTARASIDFVKQNTFLKVDEEGTEAAAVTTVALEEKAGPIPFIVDRPFLIAIRERLSGTILFLGAIGDPR